MKQMVQVQKWQQHNVVIVLDFVNQQVLYLQHAKGECRPDLLRGKVQVATMVYVSNTRESACG
jgi:hypothetical protein